MENRNGPRVDPEKLREFQDGIERYASRTPDTTTPETSGTASGLRKIGRSPAFARKLAIARQQAAERAASTPAETLEDRLERLEAEEAERRRLWLSSIDTACGLPATIKGVDWDDLDAGDTPQGSVVQGWARSGSRPCWLYLAGPVGRGKTVLAAMALRYLVAQNGQWDNYRLPPERYGLFTSSRKMLAALRPYGEGIERWQEIPYLVLDDIGTENVGSPWAYDQLFGVLDERYVNMRTTILTSNLPLFPEDDRPSPLAVAFGDSGRISDRIIELATTVEFTVNDPNWRRT